MDATESQNLDLMRRWFQEVWNERREDTVDALCRPDVLCYGLGDEIVGFEGFKAGWRGILATFDDFRIDVDEMIVRGDLVASRLTLSGIHVGPGLGVTPSGKRLSFAAHNFTQWRGGQVVAGWNVIDMASAYRQIGSTIV